MQLLLRRDQRAQRRHELLEVAMDHWRLLHYGRLRERYRRVLLRTVRLHQRRRFLGEPMLVRFRLDRRVDLLTDGRSDLLSRRERAELRLPRGALELSRQLSASLVVQRLVAPLWRELHVPGRRQQVPLSGRAQRCNFVCARR